MCSLEVPENPNVCRSDVDFCFGNLPCSISTVIIKYVQYVIDPSRRI